MEEVSIIGIDLAKRSFQVHGAKADGSVAYRRELSRAKLLSFLASQPGCTVAMEACASARRPSMRFGVTWPSTAWLLRRAGARIGQLARVLEDGDCGLPEAVVELGWLLLGRIDELDEPSVRLANRRPRSLSATDRGLPSGRPMSRSATGASRRSRASTGRPGWARRRPS